MKAKTNNLKLVFWGVLIFVLLVIIIFTVLIIYNHFYEERLYKNPFFYPYTDEEYLCIDINKAETNYDLEKLSESAIISAINSNEVPKKLKKFISKANFNNLKAAGYHNQSINVNVNDYHVSYIESKCYNNRAIITFITSYNKDEHMSDFKYNIYYDKLYLKKSNDDWYVFMVFTGP